jgi:hypothetical protein
MLGVCPAAESKQIKLSIKRLRRRSDWRDFLSWQGRYEKGRERAAHKRALVWREQALGLHQRYVCERALHRLHIHTYKRRRRPTLQPSAFLIHIPCRRRQSEHSDSAAAPDYGRAEWTTTRGSVSRERFLFFLCVYFGPAAENTVMNRNAR